MTMADIERVRRERESMMKSVAVEGTIAEERGRTLTSAEAQAERVRSQRAMQRILARAEKSHKERILAFNATLAALPEHFDIPKISWTK